MIYVDPSAVVALVHNDTRGRALARWLNARPSAVVLTSVLTEVEAAALLRTSAPELLVHLPGVLRSVSRYELEPAVRALAAQLSSTTVSTAVHVATALTVLGADVEAFITYDRVTADAAVEHGLPVLAPQA